MAACQDSTVILKMWKINEDVSVPLPPAPFDSFLTFLLKVVAGQIVYPDSKVFLGTVLLSSVSGTCQPVANPDGTAMTLQFTWDRVDVFMTGFTYLSGFTRFRGCWLAKTHMGALPNEFSEALRSILVAPDDGDTGTATGQQT
jgi:hypothetical protein